LVVPQAGLGPAGGLLDRRTFEGWVPKLGLQFYLFPVLALSGEVAIAEELVMPHVTDGALQLFEHSYGGCLDLAMFRLKYGYTERALIPRPGAQRALRSLEVIHQIGIGVVF
jgi:hypothetical protein